MPVDPMDDIELRSVQLQFSNGRSSLGGNCDMHRVITDKGEVMVAVQGDTTKPAILTYHDLGLNCKYIWQTHPFRLRRTNSHSTARTHTVAMLPHKRVGFICV